MVGCKRRLLIPAQEGLKKRCKKVKRACGLCAQINPPSRRRYGRVGRFPVPMRLWGRVSLDVFSMPEERHEGLRVDALLLCVDWMTGWIVAIPTQKNGLTAEKAVKLLLQKWLDVAGGIPSVITSDQGAQFVGAWFQGMCSRMGMFPGVSGPGGWPSGAGRQASPGLVGQAQS